jgi:prepilin-type N-terminal cleavage/methylation domain-containing protein
MHLVTDMPSSPVRTHPRGDAAQAGFSLPEMLIATAMLATAIASIGQLFAIAMTSSSGAHSTTYAVVLASEKMEHLRSQPFTELIPSPEAALLESTDGYVDYLDTSGRSLGGGASLPDGTEYIRRWSIDPLPDDPDRALVLQVLVTRLRRGPGAAPGRVGRMPHDARIVTVRTRNDP